MDTHFCMTRRRFLQSAAASLAASCLPSPAWAASTVAPANSGGAECVSCPLGKTGLNVSLLAFGSHTDHAYKLPGGIRNILSAEGQARRDRQIAKAIDLGVNLIDVYEHEGNGSLWPMQKSGMKSSPVLE